MKQVIVYEADDGARFSTEAECKVYETEFQLVQLVGDHFASQDTTNVVDFIQDYWSKLSDIMLSRAAVVETEEDLYGDGYNSGFQGHEANNTLLFGQDMQDYRRGYIDGAAAAAHVIDAELKNKATIWANQYTIEGAPFDKWQANYERALAEYTVQARFDANNSDKLRNTSYNTY